jgi:1-acyl-sn-glycerol-3-phosphate acyltransferase
MKNGTTAPPSPPLAPPHASAWIHSPWFPLWHEAFYLTAHVGFTLGFSLRMCGGRNMPRTGPALIVANHQSYLDPPLIGLVARRPLVYLARKTLFRNRFFAALIHSLNAVPIDQEGVGKEGLRTLLEQLHQGHAVMMFPEGARTPDGKMHPLAPGIHLLIRRTEVPIVPVGIAGAYDAWPIWRPWPIPAPLFCPPAAGNIAVSMGEPIETQRLARMPREEALQELFDRIATQQAQAEALRRRT